MTKCFGYIRVSTQKQGDGASLEAQQSAISEFAAKNDIIISQWFEERETAAKSGRPVFNRMISDLKRGRAEGLVIHRIDRSARNFRDWAAIGELSDAGIDVHFATESLDFRSRGGRLVADIQVAVAADYCRNLSIEARKGINGRLKQGYYPFPAPVGYIDNGGGNVKTPDPATAPLLRELFELYLSGEHSINSLHETMSQRGLRTRTGKPLSRRTIELILANPFYCGLTRNGRTGEVFQGKHEPLITQRQFERIADIKAGRYTKKKTKQRHLLRRLFFCANCGGLMTGERQKTHLIYYRCHTKGCTSRTVREEFLESAIVGALGQLQFSDKDTDFLWERYQTWDASRRLEDAKASLNLRVAEAKSRLEKLTDFLIDGAIDQYTYAERRATLVSEINRLEQECVDTSEMAISQEDLAEFFELMKTLKNLYISGNHGEKRRIVENCFSNRTWDGKNVELEPSELVEEAKSELAVTHGGAMRGTFRTVLKLLDCPNNGAK
jgi:DNA invertase Pin-like site-specific DNA recombinase